MTTLAYRDGVLAADSLVQDNGLIVGETTKIIKCKRGFLAGAVGDCGTIANFLDWVFDGQSGEIDMSAAGSIGVLVSPDGNIRVFQGVRGSCVLALTFGFYADGTGAMAAFGAMAQGANAEEAVKIACRFDCNSGPPVVSVSLGN